MRLRRSRRLPQILPGLDFERLVELSQYHRQERALRRWMVACMGPCNPIAIVWVLLLLEKGKLSGSEAATILGVVLAAVNVTLYLIVRNLFPDRT